MKLGAMPGCTQPLGSGERQAGRQHIVPVTMNQNDRWFGCHLIFQTLRSGQRSGITYDACGRVFPAQTAAEAGPSRKILTSYEKVPIVDTDVQPARKQATRTLLAECGAESGCSTEACGGCSACGAGCGTGCASGAGCCACSGGGGSACSGGCSTFSAGHIAMTLSLPLTLLEFDKDKRTAFREGVAATAQV